MNKIQRNTHYILIGYKTMVMEINKKALQQNSLLYQNICARSIAHLCYFQNVLLFSINLTICTTVR